MKKNTLDRPIVQSYGLGTQSIAIWLLCEEGRLPMPDMIVIADTAREASRGWKYNLEHIFPRMLAAGANVHIAPHSLATQDLYDDNGDLLIPAFTQQGKLPGFCSSQWKTRVVRRYLKQLYGPDFKCYMWLGMSTDELERLKHSDVRWAENHYPLCDMPVSGGYGVRMARADCFQYITSRGFPPPPKSACKICPHTPDVEWARMKEEEPGGFAEAVATDYLIRANDQFTKLQARGLYLHKSRKPLDTIDFRSTPAEETLLGCSDSFCWT